MIDVPLSSLLDHTRRLEGAVVFITGGANGFGRGLAELVTSVGAKVFIVDLNTAAMTTVVETIKKAGGKCTSFTGDVTSVESMRAAFGACMAVYGQAPDVVYANAGVATDDALERDDGGKPFVDITSNVNLNGLLNTCGVAQEVWAREPPPNGRKRRLVVTASIAGVVALPVASMYGSSKHAVLGYWKGLNDDLAAGKLSGFECHAIAPTFAMTNIVPPAMRFVVNSIPVVEVKTCIQSLAYAGCAPLDGGVVIFLPDTGNPCILRSADYDPVGDSLQQGLETRMASHQEWRKTQPSSFSKTWWGLLGT